MRVTLVLALAAVALREPDAPVGDTVDGADVDAVRANHFHVLGDLVRGHLVSPLVSPIALEQGVLRQAEPRELPTRVRREEIAVARAEVSRRGHARAASQNELPGHELAIVHADRAVDRAEARVRRERAARPLPDVAEHLLHPGFPWVRGFGPEAIEVQEVA